VTNYNSNEAVAEWERFRSTHDIASELNPLHLVLDDIFLDLGCGTGHHVFSAAERVREAWGVDSSKQMIESAANRASDLQLANAFWRCMDLRQPVALDLPPVTKVFSWGLLHYLTTNQQESLLLSLRSHTAPQVRLSLSLPVFSVTKDQRLNAVANHVAETSRQSKYWADKLREVLLSHLVGSALCFESVVNNCGFVIDMASPNKWGTWSEYLLRRSA